MSAVVDDLMQLAPANVRREAATALHRHIQQVILDKGHVHAHPMASMVTQLDAFPCGFIYDRSGWLLDCGYTAHARTAAALAQLHLLTTPFDTHAAQTQLWQQREALAERYLEEGWGFVVNSPITRHPNRHHPWSVRLGAGVALTAQEKLWFRTFDLLRHG